MDFGLINAFLAREDLNEHDSMLKQNALSLNETLQKLTSERNELMQNLQRKEQEVLKVSGALENQASIIEHLARKMGLEPLETEQAEQSQQQPTEQVQLTE